MGVWTATPHDATAGAVLTAAQWDATVRDGFTAFGAMTAYTPAWTASTTDPVIGNGTIVGAYTQIQKSVWFRIRLTIGSTTTFGSGGYRFSLPVTGVSPLTGAGDAVGQSAYYDTSGSARGSGTAYQISTTAVSIINASTGTSLSPTVPWTWANGDTLSISGWYEAA